MREKYIYLNNQNLHTYITKNTILLKLFQDGNSRKENVDKIRNSFKNKIIIIFHFPNNTVL